MTTSTVDTHREKMLRRLDDADGYAFLTMATPYLEVCPADDYVRLMAVREYLKLNLITPARDLIREADDKGELSAELRTVAAPLERVVDVRFDWPQRVELFDRNLQVLCDRGIEVDSIRDAWSKESSRFQLFQDGNGIDQVRARTETGHWRWVPRLGDHVAIESAMALPADVDQPMPGPYLFEGLDLGSFVRRVSDRTRHSFHAYCCALFVVEPDLAAMALWLHLAEWTDFLSDERVRLFLGDGCVERLRRAWGEDTDLPIPRQAYSFNSVRSPPGAVAVVQEVSTARENAIDASYADVESQYASRDGRYWAKRFAEAISKQGSPLRILAAVSQHTTFLKHSMRDARRALESLGHRCIVLTESNMHTAIGPLTYHNTIRDFDPDLFLNIDHLRPDFADLLPTNLPLLCWDQDQLPQVFTKENVAKIGPFDFVAGYAKAKCVVEGCDPAQLMQARVPTCPEQFSGPPLTDEERARFECDVSYVSHASQSPEDFHREERAQYADPAIARLMDAMFEVAPSMLGPDRVMTGPVAARVLGQAQRQCGVAFQDDELRRRMTDWYLWRLGDRLFRHEALGWVSKWAKTTGRMFRIYGKGWEHHATLSQHAAGAAQNGRELLCVHRASKINLQLMPAGFVHQRALDGLAAGGFFLSRRTPADSLGRLIHNLNERINRLQITSTAELLDSDDAMLQRWIHEMAPGGYDLIDRTSQQFIAGIEALGELDHADDVFDSLGQIMFDSEESFAQKAESFLADIPKKDKVAKQMREVVVDRFAYRGTMEKFLQNMSSFLSKRFL